MGNYLIQQPPPERQEKPPPAPRDLELIRTAADLTAAVSFLGSPCTGGPRRYT